MDPKPVHPRLLDLLAIVPPDECSLVYYLRRHHYLGVPWSAERSPVTAMVQDILHDVPGVTCRVDQDRSCFVVTIENGDDEHANRVVLPDHCYLCALDYAAGYYPDLIGPRGVTVQLPAREQALHLIALQIIETTPLTLQQVYNLLAGYPRCRTHDYPPTDPLTRYLGLVFRHHCGPNATVYWDQHQNLYVDAPDVPGTTTVVPDHLVRRLLRESRMEYAAQRRGGRRER